MIKKKKNLSKRPTLVFSNVNFKILVLTDDVSAVNLIGPPKCCLLQREKPHRGFKLWVCAVSANMSKNEFRNNISFYKKVRKCKFQFDFKCLPLTFGIMYVKRGKV